MFSECDDELKIIHMNPFAKVFGCIYMCLMNIIHMEASTKIYILKLSNLLAEYAAWVMMPYLTDVWKLNLTKAAAIVNVWSGLSDIMQMGIAFLADILTGKYWMLLLSTIAYNVGLGFLYLSTPPVLHNSTGTCSEYKPECIGNTQRIMFYTALAMITVGLCGRETCLGSFLEENQEVPPKKLFIWILLSIFGMIAPIIADITQPYIKAWSIQFGILAACNFVATLIFLSGLRSYRGYRRPEGSPLTNVLRVFVASTSKIFQQLPNDCNQLYNKDNTCIMSIHTQDLRWLDKAAIILPTKTLEEQEKRIWTLCGVKEVEVTKRLVRMVPICIAFVICGLVISVGNTYFIEQANNMDRRVGRIKVPLTFFMVFYKFTEWFFHRPGFVDNNSEYSDFWIRLVLQFSATIKTFFIIVSAELCFIVAAIVETQRLSVIRKHGLLSKPDTTIPMSVFCLLPQFFLLASADGLYKRTITRFFLNHTPSCMANYGVFFHNGVIGIGTISSVLSVYLVGKFSEIGDKPNWFHYTLNTSRLDLYYWVLVVLLAVTFVYCYFAMRYLFAHIYDEKDSVDGI